MKESYRKGVANHPDPESCVALSVSAALPALSGRAMKKLRIAVSLCIPALALVSCARAQKYHPAPVSPPAVAAGLEARSLSDTSLKEYLEKNLGQNLAPWPPKVWDLGMLTLAAFYFNPGLQTERARVQAAEAAVITAGARPNPTLAITPGVPSPYLLGIDFDVPIETHGKRGLRVAKATSLSDAARLNLAETAWKIRSRVRAAGLDYLVALRSVDLLRSESRLRSEQVTLGEQRLRVGEIGRPAVSSARVALLEARQAVRAGEGREAETQAALAEAIGIPVSGLSGTQVSWPGLEHPPRAQSLAPREIQRDAVLNRVDVRQGLAEYAAAEADLRLEIARQYPDFQIGPGYQLEERDSFFTIPFSIVLPLRSRNQGPIAEAEARRKEAAARFLATQAKVIAESEQAGARFRAALAELEEADRALSELERVQEPMARYAVTTGESDRLTLNAVMLQGTVAASARLNALYRAQSALGALEDAVQRPLEPGQGVLPISPAPPQP